MKYEFRWINRKNEYYDSTDPSLMPITNRILQYRYLKEYNFVTTGVWSDWQDVPVVEAEEGNATKK